VLVAPRAKLEAMATQASLDLSGIVIEDVPHSHAAAARAVELAREGQVEALMKGSLHTDELMAAVVAHASGLRTKRRVSHCFVLQTPPIRDRSSSPTPRSISRPTWSRRPTSCGTRSTSPMSSACRAREWPSLPRWRR
jgi:hypothetical protein